MNSTHRILLPMAAAVALAAPLMAQASSTWHPAANEAGGTAQPDHATTSKTRAEVQAETEVARKDGSLALLRIGVPLTPKSTAAPKTRQQVIAEMNNESAESRRARELALIGGA